MSNPPKKAQAFLFRIVGTIRKPQLLPSLIMKFCRDTYLFFKTEKWDNKE
jgi:hypothetical protein